MRVPNGRSLKGMWLVGVLTCVFAVAAASSARIGDTGCLSSGVQPQYAALGSAPIARAIQMTGSTAAPAGAVCFDKSDSTVLWITVASLIQSSDSRSTFIGRFGAVCQLLGVQYWSTTDQAWRPRVSSAHATNVPNPFEPRADYSAAELATGQDRYYETTDTRSGRSVAYRLRLLLNQPGRVVIETANVEAIKKWGLTIYGPEGLDTMYFLDERSPGVWAYYSITRVLPRNFLAEGHEKSYINRAVALYRHYVSLPTNAEPPSAP
jgi:hypothetical protein